jgi:hypothetical protein
MTAAHRCIILVGRSEIYGIHKDEKEKRKIKRIKVIGYQF